MDALTLKNDTKNKTSRHADKIAGDDEITIKSAKIFPNTWKPKAKANITETDGGDLAIFELDEDDVILDKEYKITYKVRVGRGIPSGPLEIPIAFEGPGIGLDEALMVLVK